MKNRIFICLLSLLLAITVIGSAGVVTAFAEGEDEEQVAAENIGEDIAQPEQQEPAPGEDQQVITDPEQSRPEDTPVEETSAPEQEDVTEAEQFEPIYEYFYSYPEDATSAYEAPQYLGELPEVSPSEVVEATAVVIPDVAVSDASMFSGIVMWLCVALGIAVIVGVLVSKRTRRRGV